MSECPLGEKCKVPKFDTPHRYCKGCGGKTNARNPEWRGENHHDKHREYALRGDRYCTFCGENLVEYMKRYHCNKWTHKEYAASGQTSCRFCGVDLTKAVGNCS